MHEPPPPPIQTRGQTSPFSPVVILLAIIAGLLGLATVFIGIAVIAFLTKPTAYEQFKTDVQKNAKQFEEQLREKARKQERINDWDEQVLKKLEEMEKAGKPVDEISRYQDANWHNPPAGFKSP